MDQKKGILVRIFDRLEKIANTIVFVLLSVIVALVFSNVICRYFLGFSIAWSEEISRFFLIWLVFFGAIVAYIRNEHLGLDLLVKKMGARLASITAIVAHLLVAYVLWLLAGGGYILAMRSMDWLSPATSTSYGYVYLVVPICCSIMLLQTAYKIIGNIKNLIQGKEEPSC